MVVGSCTSNIEVGGILRTLKRNTQRMYYALFKGSEPIYELDNDGNRIVEYEDEEGNVYYRENGTEHSVYYPPVEFHASISSKLNEMHAREYGVDQSSIYSELTCSKGLIPLEYGAKIWRKSEVEWLDKNFNIPDETSSDYTVIGILDEFPNEDYFLLKRNNKETK